MPLSTDRNLLFGVLALQAGLIDNSQFAKGCALWTAQDGQSLADVLAEQGWLTAEDRSHVEYLLQRKLDKHAGDAQASLAAVTTSEARHALAEIDDPAIQQSIGHLSAHTGNTLISTIAYRPSSRERYTLTQLHAKGGMSQVWLAHDADLSRQVALKELRPELAENPSAWARFLEEAKITGQLEHPSIVPVYELAKSGADKKPFYTMRFIKGRTLADAIKAYHQKREAGKASSMDLGELLTTFVGVCNAVAYAHSRGVLHRDLKPRNVVLGDFGEVIVLDWGLAKVIGQTDGPRSLLPVSLSQEDSHEMTVQGQVLGTPSYMAPEQAEGRHDLVDERSDVYGLGAIFYAILSGQPPHRGDDTHELIRRVIQEPVVPPRQLVAATTPVLEAICLKALARRREDRYGSAKELAQEVRHWLAGEPVLAYPEPWIIKTRRWLSRHRTLATATAATLLVATLSLAIATALLTASNERERQARDLAEKNYGEARAAEQQAEAINKFLVHDLLAEAAPERNPRNKKVTVEEVLSRATAKVAKAFAGRPEIEASIRYTLGETYQKLGDYKSGEENARRAVMLFRQVRGGEHPDTLRAVDNLVWQLTDLSRLAEAEQLARQNLEDCLRVLGAENPITVHAMLALPNVFFSQSRLAEAESLLRQALEGGRRILGPDDREILDAENQLAAIISEQERLDEAETLFRQILERMQRVLGPDDPTTLVTLDSMAAMLLLRGKSAEAEPLYRRCLEAKSRVLGPDHDSTFSTLSDLADSLRSQGKPGEAEPLLLEALPRARKALPPQHDSLDAILMTLGMVLTDLGRAREGEPLLRECLQNRSSKHAKDSWLVASAQSELGGCLLTQKRYVEAEPFLVSAGQTFLERGEGPPLRRREALERLVKLYESWSKPEKAKEWKAKLDKMPK
jgi:serine/threonine protein kinase